MMSMQAATEKRRLGRTDLEVTPLGLGRNKFSGGKGLTGLTVLRVLSGRRRARGLVYYGGRVL